MVFEISSKDKSHDWLYPMFIISVVTDFTDKIYDQNKVIVNTYSTGLIHFMYEKKADANFDYQDFVKECLDIELIIENISKEHFVHSIRIKETREHYEAINKEVDVIVQKFVEKYNLILKKS
jgi:hypothetical protein